MEYPADDPNGNWHPEVFANAPLVAASFNPELFREVGEFIGEEALFTGIPILWGPGLNTHRHAYNGRNCEYYSEDPVLSGVAAMEFAIGALDYGLIAAPKHYAFNDQETHRSGVAPYSAWNSAPVRSSFGHIRSHLKRPNMIQRKKMPVCVD